MRSSFSLQPNAAQRAHPTRVQIPSPPQTRFGATSNFPTNLFSTIQRYPLAELAAKDVLCFNALKILMTRTLKELKDVATLELSNTGITLALSLTLPKLLTYLTQSISKVPIKDLTQDLSAGLPLPNTKTKLARLGLSFAFLLPFASAFWGAAFFRNWLTLKRTQSADFESLIGFENTTSKKPKRSFQDELAYQRNKVFQILGIGTGMGALSLTTLKVLISNQKAFHFLETKGKKALDFLFDTFSLKGKTGTQISGRACTLLFWGLPAYFGWMHAARSDNEGRERFFQSATGILGFFGIPVITKHFWSKDFVEKAAHPELWSQTFLEKTAESKLLGTDFAQEFKQNKNFMKKLEERVQKLNYSDIEQHFNRNSPKYREMLRLQNKRFVNSEFLAPIAMLASVQLFNMFLTNRKLNQKKPTPKPRPQTAIPRPHLPPFTPQISPFALPRPSQNLQQPSFIKPTPFLYSQVSPLPAPVLTGTTNRLYPEHIAAPSA